MRACHHPRSHYVLLLYISSRSCSSMQRATYSTLPLDVLLLSNRCSWMMGVSVLPLRIKIASTAPPLLLARQDIQLPPCSRCVALSHGRTQPFGWAPCLLALRFRAKIAVEAPPTQPAETQNYARPIAAIWRERREEACREGEFMLCAFFAGGAPVHRVILNSLSK